MLEIYSSMACGEIAGRFAFDLPTGCGKTQSLIAWCQAVHEIKSGHSAVIATSKVEELCNIKRKLIAKGVPEECVGLVHSKLCDQERVREWLLTRDPSALKEMGGIEGLGVTFLETDRVEVITGLNLAMLMKLARPLKETDLLTLARDIREQGRNAIWVASDLIRGERT